MALNTRFATSIHALLVLAVEPHKLHTSEEIAGELHTNPVVVRRIFTQLLQAGLVVSQKGPSGGSRLAHSAKDITLRDIYRAVHPQGLLRAPSSASGFHAALKRVLNDASRAFEKELDETTLAQLAKKAAKNAKS